MARSSIDWSLFDDSATDSSLAQAWTRLLRYLFRDRVGLLVFLTGLAFLGLYWRVGIFLNDSYAVGNTLVNVAEGRLTIERTPYSLTLGSQPGLHVVDGRLYGRNYGHAFLSLPVLWLLQGLSVLFDIRLVVVAGWCLLVVAAFDQLGHVLDEHRPVALAGTMLAGVFFLASATVASPLQATWLPFVALQFTTMVAAAFAGVCLYRLLALIADRRTGGVLGLAAVIATPVGFWGSIPKRHVVTAAAAMLMLLAFYHSRRTDAADRALTYRAVAYAIPAVLAWVTAPEALGLLMVLGPIDLATARSNTARRLAILALVFTLALSPFLVTNTLISGNPITPPRLLPDYTGQELGSAGGGDAGNGGSGTAATVTPETATPAGTGTASPPGTPAGGTPGGGETPAGGTSSTGAGTATGSPPESETAPPTPDTDPPGDSSGGFASRVGYIVDRGIEELTGGFHLLVDEPSRVYHTFVRSGRIPVKIYYAINEQEAIELTVLESAPLFGALVGLPLVALGRLRSHSRDLPGTVRRALGDPVRQTDLLASLLVVLFVVAYLPELPLRSQITVRYLVPTYPLLLYAAGRTHAVRRVLETDWRWVAGWFVSLTTLGALGLLGYHLSAGLAIGEAMQLHALLNLASALLLAGWVVVSVLSPSLLADRRWMRAGSAAIGITMGLTTLFLLFSGILYFQYGQYMLPLVRVFAELLPFAF